jgi:hypothetical protein
MGTVNRAIICMNADPRSLQERNLLNSQANWFSAAAAPRVFYRAGRLPRRYGSPAHETPDKKTQKQETKDLPMSNFLTRQIANLALVVELSVLGAVIVFMITTSLGVSPTIAA